MKTNRKKLLLVIACLFLLVGCSANPGVSINTSTDESGNYVIKTTGHRTVMIDALPYDLSYNDAYISLVGVSFYENVSDYSHNLFIVTTLDVSNLTDQQLHWLRESDLEVGAYLTFDKNDYDFDTVPALGSLLLTDTKQLLFVHTSSFFKENRYSFSGAQLSLTVTATQEETYEYTSDSGTTRNLHATEELHYRTIVGSDIPDPENIEDPLNKYVKEWLYKIGNAT